MRLTKDPVQLARPSFPGNCMRGTPTSENITRPRYIAARTEFGTVDPNGLERSAHPET